MLIRNIKLTITAVTEKEVTLESELGQTITLNADFLENATVGQTIYLCADQQPVKLTEDLAKDVLNNLLDEKPTN